MEKRRSHGISSNPNEKRERKKYFTLPVSTTVPAGTSLFLPSPSRGLATNSLVLWRFWATMYVMVGL